VWWSLDTLVGAHREVQGRRGKRGHKCDEERVRRRAHPCKKTNLQGQASANRLSVLSVHKSGLLEVTCSIAEDLRIFVGGDTDDCHWFSRTCIRQLRLLF